MFSVHLEDTAVRINKQLCKADLYALIKSVLNSEQKQLISGQLNVLKKKKTATKGELHLKQPQVGVTLPGCFK